MLLPPGACSLGTIPEPHTFPVLLETEVRHALSGRFTEFLSLLNAVGFAWARYASCDPRNLVEVEFERATMHLQEAPGGTEYVRALRFRVSHSQSTVLCGRGKNYREAALDLTTQVANALSAQPHEPHTYDQEGALFVLEESLAVLRLALVQGIRFPDPSPLALLWALGVRWREWIYEVEMTRWIMHDKRHGTAPRRARVTLTGEELSRYGLRLDRGDKEVVRLTPKGTIAEAMRVIGAEATGHLTRSVWTTAKADDEVKAEGNVQDAAEFFAFAINDLLSWCSTTEPDRWFAR